VANKKSRVAMSKQKVDSLNRELSMLYERKASSKDIEAKAARLKQAKDWLKNEESRPDD